MPFSPLSPQQDQDLLIQLISDQVLVDPASAKGKLLKAAAHLFKTNGFDKTTVRDLAKAVGIQSGSLFHHYPNKQEILKQVMQQAILLNVHRVQLALSQNQDIRSKLQALILCELQAILLETGAEMAVLVHEWRSLSQENQQYMLSLREEYEQFWLSNLEQAQQQGLIDLPPAILRRLVAGSIYWSINWYKTSGDIALEQLAQMTLRMILASNPTTNNNK